MQTPGGLKALVQQKYGEIALQDKAGNQSSCCGSTCCSTEIYNIMSEDYSALEGYDEQADLGLGCGLPTQFANIKKGDIVIDLGSGAGNDCFVARAETGESGQHSNHINEYRDVDFDFVITVCDNAKEHCPFFPSNAKKFHHNFSDPAKAAGSETEIMAEFARVREEIKDYCREFTAANL